MNPDRVCLARKRSETTVSSIMGVFEVNAYIFNNEFSGGEIVVISPWCNRDTMRHENISENTRREIYLDR
jgi:hypothetical protein